MKDMYVLPGILSVAQVNNLPEKVLAHFADVSTTNVENTVTRFIEDNKDSTDPKVKSAVDKMSQIYKKHFVDKEFVNGDVMQEYLDVLFNLDIKDININCGYEKLCDYRNKLMELQSYENMIKPLNAENFVKTVNAMLSDARELDDGSNGVYAQTNSVVSRMKTLKSIFVNSEQKAVTRSKLSTAMKYKDKINTLLDVLNSTLSTFSEDGLPGNPRTWRWL